MSTTTDFQPGGQHGDQPTERPPTMREEVAEGMRRTQKTLPSKYFYDERGSKLFEQITLLEEYYLTRTEIGIMERHISEIARLLGRSSVLVELGSGSSRKTRLLLDHLEEIAAYVPVDISREYLSAVARELRDDYPQLDVRPVCADYTRPFSLPELEQSRNGLKQPGSGCQIFYPGSTIGNFRPPEARRFLARLARNLHPLKGMLVGVDLKKEKEILEAAYNDARGVTAAFNKNILHHINRELEADFRPEYFRHEAFYNEREGRVEMHLVSLEKQEIAIGHERFVLAKGESIHTENSYKYTPGEFRELASPHFTVERVWTDDDHYFSIQYLRYRDNEKNSD